MKEVIAFYYPWYRSLSDWNSELLKDKPDPLYTSDDPLAIKRHIQQAKECGIDAFCCSWWGINDWRGTDDCLEIIFEVAKREGFKVCPYFETITDSGAPIGGREIFKLLKYLIDKYGNHEASFKVNGKILIPIWQSAQVSLDVWREIFTRLENTGRNATFFGMGGERELTLFDGIYRYTPPDWPTFCAEYEILSRAAKAHGKLWAATVMPGFWKLGAEWATKDRDDGKFYESTWKFATNSKPDMIFITSWNEFYEHTHIEPSGKLGDNYLNLTKRLIEKWR